MKKKLQKTEKPSEDGKKDESGTGEPESETTESGTGETESETTGSPDETGTEDNSTKTDIETEEKNESTTGSETQSHKLEETVSMHLMKHHKTQGDFSRVHINTCICNKGRREP